MYVLLRKYNVRLRMYFRDVPTCLCAEDILEGFHRQSLDGQSDGHERIKRTATTTTRDVGRPTRSSGGRLGSWVRSIQGFKNVDKGVGYLTLQDDVRVTLRLLVDGDVQEKLNGIPAYR